MVFSQGDSCYVIFDLEIGEFVLCFVVVDGEVDGMLYIDGLDVFLYVLGLDFLEGVFVVQDDEEDMGGQNFKVMDFCDIWVVLMD